MLGTQAEHRCAGKEQQRSQSRKLCSSSGLYGDKSWEMEVWVKSQTALDGSPYSVLLASSRLDFILPL